MKFAVAQDRDANFQVIGGGLPFRASKSRTFTGAANLGAQGATTLFTVTGAVAVRVIGLCTTDIVGAATLEVGISGNTAALLAQIADASNLDAGESYLDATPSTVESVDLMNGFILTNGQDIIETIGAADITAGVLEYVALWRPLNSTGNLVAA